MLWKIYFWIYSILTIIGLLVLIQYLVNFNLADWLSGLESILLVLGLYSYIFGKKIFSKKVWKIVFWVMLVFWIQTLLDIFVLSGMIEKLLPFLKISIPISSAEAVMSIIISLPGLLAIYRLGYKKS